MEFGGGVASFSFLPEPPSPGTRSAPLTCLPLESQKWAVPELPATMAAHSLPRDAVARTPEPSCGPRLTPHLGKPPLHRELFSRPSPLARAALTSRSGTWVGRLKPGAATGCP